MRIVLTPNPYRDRNFVHVQQAVDILEASGIETRVCLPFDVDKNYELPQNFKLYDLSKEIKNSDMLICFGGDGTILHSSKIATRHHVPILGVNMGTMGFMAELESGDLSLLSRIATGEYKIEKRMMLRVTVHNDGNELFNETALNDAAITKGAIARVIQMSVECDGVEAINCSGDGVLISTPTGSTAYSMSAGGAVVDPRMDAMIVTPICSHSLNATPLVFSAESELIIKNVTEREEKLYLNVDGCEMRTLTYGDTVTLRKGNKGVGFIRIKDGGFYQVLRHKMADIH